MKYILRNLFSLLGKAHLHPHPYIPVALSHYQVSSCIFRKHIHPAAESSIGSYVLTKPKLY